jgi:hypothetical protein
MHPPKNCVIESVPQEYLTPSMSSAPSEEENDENLQEDESVFILSENKARINNKDVNPNQFQQEPRTRPEMPDISRSTHTPLCPDSEERGTPVPLVLVEANPF